MGTSLANRPRPSSTQGRATQLVDGATRPVAIWFFVTILLAGCTDPDLGKYADVTGTITLDGKPIDGATIQFLPDNARRSQGQTDAFGHYELSVDQRTKGAWIGDHSIVISKFKPPELIEQVPEKYNRETVLRRTVSAGRNVIDFELTSDPGDEKERPGN